MWDRNNSSVLHKRNPANIQKLKFGREKKVKWIISFQQLGLYLQVFHLNKVEEHQVITCHLGMALWSSKTAWNISIPISLLSVPLMVIFKKSYMQSLTFGCPVIHLLGSKGTDYLGGTRGEERNQHRTTGNHLKITNGNYGYLIWVLVSISNAEQSCH